MNGKTLKKKMDEAEISVSQMAEWAGVSHQTVRNWIKGSTIKEDYIDDINKTLGLKKTKSNGKRKKTDKKKTKEPIIIKSKFINIPKAFADEVELLINAKIAEVVYDSEYEDDRAKKLFEDATITLRKYEN